jgi:hypothetical protein
MNVVCLSSFLQESLVSVFIIILITQFWLLKIFLVWVKLPKNIVLYVVTKYI